MATRVRKTKIKPEAIVNFCQRSHSRYTCEANSLMLQYKCEYFELGHIWCRWCETKNNIPSDLCRNPKAQEQVKVNDRPS